MASPSTSQTILQQGYLLKRNKEHHKSNLIGSKYKRRWVELTQQTLVYAASKHDVLTGRIQVFSVADMVWVKPDAETKFQVKFPERVLKFKLDFGGKEERAMWVAALEAAKQQQKVVEQARVSGVHKLEHLQKVLLHSEADRASTSGSAATPAHSRQPGPAPSTHGSHSQSGRGLSTSIISHDGGDPSMQFQRPPSPRSLLASAKSGMAFMDSTSGEATGNVSPGLGAARSRAGVAATGQQQQQQKRQGDKEEHWDRAVTNDSFGSSRGTGRSSGIDGCESDNDPESSDSMSSTPSLASGTAAQQGVCEAVPLQLHIDGTGGVVHGKGSKDGSSCSCPLPIVEADPSTPRTNMKRGSLTRQLTPGVMLVSSSSSSRPSTPGTCSGSHDHSNIFSTHTPRLNSTTAAAALAGTGLDAGTYSATGERVRSAPPATASKAAPAATGARAFDTLPNQLQGSDDVLVLEQSSGDDPVQLHNEQHAYQVDAETWRLQAGATQHSTAPKAAQASSAQQSSSSTPRLSQVYTSSTPAAAINNSSSHGGDEVLRLDLDDQEFVAVSPSQGSQVGALQPAAGPYGIGSLRPGLLQAVRPGSAGRPASAANRPGTPLKSCLRSTH